MRFLGQRVDILKLLIIKKKFAAIIDLIFFINSPIIKILSGVYKISKTIYFILYGFDKTSIETKNISQ